MYWAKGNKKTLDWFNFSFKPRSSTALSNLLLAFLADQGLLCATLPRQSKTFPLLRSKCGAPSAHPVPTSAFRAVSQCIQLMHSQEPLKRKPKEVSEHSPIMECVQPFALASFSILAEFNIYATSSQTQLISSVTRERRQQHVRLPRVTIKSWN